MMVRATTFPICKTTRNPCLGTMSAFASYPGTIRVGSADILGRWVSQFSSRGCPLRPETWPTVVAPGENIIRQWPTYLRKSEAQQRLDEFWITLENIRLQTGQFFDEIDLPRLRAMHTVMSGTSMATPYVAAQLVKFRALRRQLGLSETLADALGFLQRVARPIPGFGRHEQGFGFISEAMIRDYFARTSIETDSFWRVAPAVGR